MPGIATHFKILELTMNRLNSSGDPNLENIGNIMENNSQYAYLGAIGPALADFIPSGIPEDIDPTGPGAIGYGNSFTNIWKGALQIVGGDGTDANPGLLLILERFQSFLNQIQPIIDTEDLGALISMRDSGVINTIINTGKDLNNVVLNLTQPGGYVYEIAGRIGEGMKPAVNVNDGNPVPQPDVWTAREFLFWQKTGKYAEVLLKRAEESGDQRFMAYAYGYTSSYAGFIAGSSFINSIIGGTYRSDWWRYRWINNFIDAWVYGYYETGASMSGDTPTPEYQNWKSLCDAKLHSKIELPGMDPIDMIHRLSTNANFPQILPSDFDTYWFSTFEEVYGPRSPVSRFKPNSTNGAYIMTWLMLWFQTSGQVVGCNAAPSMEPPADCKEPDWVNPTAPSGGGSGSIPLTLTIESDPDEGKIITGIILILLGYSGGAGLIGGGRAIADGIDLVISGALEINWNRLRCDVHWYRQYLYNGLTALHDAMVLSGLQHPYPSQMAVDEIIMTFLGINFPFDSGKKNTKSRNLERFPPVPWDGKFNNLWISRPNRKLEEAVTLAYETPHMYPNFFIDDDTNNPLGNGDIKSDAPQIITSDGGNLRIKDLPSGEQQPVQFGNAVSNTIDLLIHRRFPNWNLDSDRGMAYLTWKFDSIYSNPVSIEPEP